MNPIHGLEEWGGIRVNEMVQKLPKGKYYLTNLPFPTELCILCNPLTKQGIEPSCVNHCMAGCMKYGPVEELAKEMTKKAHMVLWVPR